MTYNYQTQRDNLFTEEGQLMFMKIRDKINVLLDQSGAFRLLEAISTARVTGDTWDMIACIDRLVEIGEIREIETKGVGQHRIFIRRSGS